MLPDHWAVSASLVATSALALIANALLMLVFFRRRGLRTVSNRFVINLLVTNLLSSIVLIPLLLVDQELQSPQLSVTADQHLILMANENNSARLEIANIHLEGQLAQTTTAEPNEIRHLGKHHLHSSRNQSSQGSPPEVATTTFLCYLSGGSTSLVCTASILSILLIAIDQYFAVTHPLRYHAFIDKFKSLILLVSTWLVSLLFGMMGAFVQTDSSVWNFCVRTKPESGFQSGYNIFYAFTYLILVILLPFVVICVIYGCIYCAAHRNSERMRKSNSGSSNTNLDAYIQIPLNENNRLKVKVNSSDDVTSVTSANNENVARLPKVKSAPNFANLEKTKISCNYLPVTKLCDDNNTIRASVKVSHANSLRSNASFINSLKTKISNASLFKYREETRAAKISILVIFMVLVCYVPYGLALIFNTNLITTSPSHYFNCVSLSMLVSANFLSPFLFAYRNRRIQRELRRLFGLLPKRAGCEMSAHRHPSRGRVYQPKEMRELCAGEPFLARHVIPEVVVTCKADSEKKSILKRVCSKGKTWGTAKRCNFISVPECLSVECRCSFSSASTQVSSEEYSVCN